MTIRSAKAAELRGEVVPHMPFLDFVGQAHPAVTAVLGFVEAVEALVARACTVVRRHYEMRRTMRVLSGLEEHMLKDIGLERSQIEQVARSVVLTGGRWRGSGR